MDGSGSKGSKRGRDLYLGERRADFQRGNRLSDRAQREGSEAMDREEMRVLLKTGEAAEMVRN